MDVINAVVDENAVQYTWEELIDVLILSCKFFLCPLLGQLLRACEYLECDKRAKNISRTDPYVSSAVVLPFFLTKRMFTRQLGNQRSEGDLGTSAVHR